LRYKVININPAIYSHELAIFISSLIESNVRLILIKQKNNKIFALLRLDLDGDHEIGSDEERFLHRQVCQLDGIRFGGDSLSLVDYNNHPLSESGQPTIKNNKKAKHGKRQIRTKSGRGKS